MGSPASRDDDDASFWTRQDSLHPQYDHPDMTSQREPPSHPEMELFVTSAAGKPLYHFCYDTSDVRHPRHDPTLARRPSQSTASLSATLTAFVAATRGNVPVIRSSAFVLLVHSYRTIRLVLLARQNPAPLAFLNTLLRLSVFALSASLSASFFDYLHRFPDATPSLSPAHPLLKSALLDAITFPLSYVSLRPLTLPSFSPPHNRHPLSQLLRNTLSDHPHVTHALMFTSAPPLPSRLLAYSGPSNSPLSPVDLLLLAALPHSNSRQPARYYPHAQMFHVGVDVVSSILQLRLHPDHHDTFKRAVGGQTWRPQWTQTAPHTIRIVVLAHHDASPFFSALDHALDRALITTRLIVSMELPFLEAHFSVPALRAVFSLRDKRRLAATVNALSYDVAIPALQALRRARVLQQVARRRNNLRDPDDIVVTYSSQWSLRIVVYQLQFVACFHHSVSQHDAIVATRHLIVPKLLNWKAIIVPEGDSSFVHPRTPLAGILAPFQS